MKIEILGDDCIVHIGARTTNTGICKLSCREKKTRIIIGEDCLLANNVMILTSDGHDIYENNMRINYAADIIIKNHVWLAENVMILKGVSIGSDCVIGANSVVTGQHDKNTIAAGNPAKTIKKNISWNERLTY
ncbi:acyltransferase [Oceanisphaera sp.]|uniref:acyltransferase n=1 Tax=Oceanisphaera sp. TaxID=1929979 RepID=UPI003A8CCA7F